MSKAKTIGLYTAPAFQLLADVDAFFEGIRAGDIQPDRSATLTTFDDEAGDVDEECECGRAAVNCAVSLGADFHMDRIDYYDAEYFDDDKESEQ